MTARIRVIYLENSVITRYILYKSKKLNLNEETVTQTQREGEA